MEPIKSDGHESAAVGHKGDECKIHRPISNKSDEGAPPQLTLIGIFRQCDIALAAPIALDEALWIIAIEHGDVRRCASESARQTVTDYRRKNQVPGPIL